MSSTHESKRDMREPAAQRRDQLIRLAEVERISGVKKSTIYGLMRKSPPEFPRCVQVTPRCVAWSAAAVFKWVDDRIAEAERRNAEMDARLPPEQPAGTQEMMRSSSAVAAQPRGAGHE